MACTLIRTSEKPWQPFPDIPGFRQRPLWYDEETGARRAIWHIPPGWGESVIPEEAMLHYHRSVTERSFGLFGDFPHWEFDDFDDIDGRIEIMNAGLFMDRPPFSLHGLKPGHLSQTGAILLYWNTGRGTSIAEPGYAEESVDVLASRRDPALRMNASRVRLLRDRDTHWDTHPHRAGWKVRRLADEVAGGDAVSLVFVPPGPSSASQAPRRSGANGGRWLYVLAGSVGLSIGSLDAALLLREHDYCAFADEPIAGPAVAGPTGCLLLCIGHALS